MKLLYKETRVALQSS